MANNNCGCDNGGDGEYLMVKATPSNPSSCGTGSLQGSAADCAKQEQMYDYSLSDFLVPIAASSGTNMLVCNPAVYCVGMWLEFVGQGVILQITNISGSTLTLANACGDGEVVDGNEDPGFAIAKNSKFVVATSPPCLTSEEELEKFQSALASATELCTPNLSIMSATAVAYPIGVIDSDPSDLGVGKCIKKLYGFLMNAGRPFFSALSTALDNDATTVANYRPLVKHKTNHGVYQKKNLSETDSLESGKQYALGVGVGSEKLLPAYMWYPIDQLIAESGTVSSTSSGTVVAGLVEKDFDLSAFSATPPETNNLNHYYVMARIEIRAYPSAGSGFRHLEVKLNDKLCGNAVCRLGDDQLTAHNTITVPIRVLKSDNKLNMKLTSTASVSAYYRLYIDAVLY